MTFRFRAHEYDFDLYSEFLGVKHVDLDSDDEVGMCHDGDVSNTAEPWNLERS